MPAVSASVRKSITDLTRRRGRTFFTALTLALAVASVFLLALPALIDSAMQDEVRAGRLADVTLFVRPVELSNQDLAALAALPNVAAIEARSSVDVRVLVGERRAAARVIGVDDLADQGVDVVRVDTGTLPAEGQLLADVQDANTALYDGEAGDQVTVLASSGGGGDEVVFEVSGRGRSLPGGEQVQDEKVIVFYADHETAAELGGEPGYSELALRLEDPSAEAAASTVDAVRGSLRSVPGFDGFAGLPEVRAPSDWPGKADTEAFGHFVSVVTLLALFSALVLISNTMSTLVAEQTRDIAVMRAIGARRRDVARIYLTTTLFLGALGTTVGVALGFALSNLLAGFFGAEFWAIGVPWRVDPSVLVVALGLGLVLPPLASLPAIRRGLRLDLREALEAGGTQIGSDGAVDRVLRRVRRLPRVTQIGLRNLGRRKRRSVATMLIVALAVANLLAVMALSSAATRATQSSWGDHLEDLQIWTSGADPFDAEAERAIRATPGVAEAEAVLKASVELDGAEAFVWAVESDPLFRYRVSAGRWFDAAEAEAASPVAVIERNLAELHGIELGDRVAVTTAAGDLELRVVGVADNQQEDGLVLFVPLATARAAVDQPSGARSYWIRTDTPDPDTVDRTTSAIEDRLGALGYEVGSEIRYLGERDEVEANRTITTTIALLGFVIVAMSMVGLANAITTNVFERTREVGILRCIGARARDVRRIFTTEGLALAAAGWLVGIPLGYLLMRALVRLVWEVADVRLPTVFPPAHLVVALIGTVVLALVVQWLPVRRAVRLKAGDALRYS